MEIIIHGKPNAGSSKSTSPSDSLSQTIVEEFFNRRDEIADQEALIVDARSWKGAWYSIYTYRLFNLKELSASKEHVGRSTYFAISLIIPNSYCCLVSEVFSLLKKVYNESIIGTYISGEGKYIVQNFDNSIDFDKVVKKINDNYTNLEENFDSKFIPCSNFSNNNRYSILDCDSKSFIQDLRSVGRIIVTETEQSKDERFANANKYIQLYNKAQSDLAEKDNQVAQLKEEKKQLETQLSNAKTTTKGKVGKLQDSIDALTTDKQNLLKERDDLKTSYEKLKVKLEKIAELLEIPKSQIQSKVIVKNAYEKDDSSSNFRKRNGWRSIVLLFNTVLTLSVLVSIFYFKGCSNVTNSEESTRTDKLEPCVPIVDTIVDNTCSDTAENENIDKDCQIKFLQNSKIVNATDVKINKEITISVQKPVEDYQFYSDNLTDAEANKLKTPTLNQETQTVSTSIKLSPKNPQKPITISYRSVDRKNINVKNKFTFNKK